MVFRLCRIFLTSYFDLGILSQRCGGSEEATVNRIAGRDEIDDLE
jgi:hypothetical protein